MFGKLIFAFLASLTLAGAAPQPQAKPTWTSKTQPSAAPTTEADAGCSDGRERRTSSLCADWQAADASSDAASWAARSFWASLVGTALLIWTLWETRSNARRQMRAYVSVKILGMEITQSPSGAATFALRIMAHNGGSTPAYDCANFGLISPLTLGQAQEALGKVMPIERGAEAAGSVIHTGEDLPVLMRNRVTFDARMLQALRDGEVTLYAYGVTSYADVFGRRRRTDFCNYLTPESFTAAYEASSKAPGEQVAVEWITAPFHNTAT